MRYIILLFFSITLMACNKWPALEVMDPIQLNRKIKVKVPRNAYLEWQIGNQFAYEETNAIGYSNNVLIDLVTASIDYQMHKNYPGRYNYIYGKAQQTVFMSSLKNILKHHHTFKNIEFVSDLDDLKLSAKDVLIIINFKHTRVINQIRIIIDVELTIKSNNKIEFQRTYFQQTTEEDYKKGMSYKELQANVSLRVLDKIISGIEQWAKHKN